MPINYVRRLTGRKRTPGANRHLGFALAFVAGAVNAGGLLAVQQYTSHMTGIVSSMADHLVLGVYDVVLGGAGGLVSFLAGAASSAVLVNYARRRRMHSEYALPLLVEASLLIFFGVVGARLSGMQGFFVPGTVMLLCFIMGLQNAVITKLSHAEIRTTHLTGILTDIGIELGKLLYRNAAGPPSRLRVMANRERLRVLALLVVFFFCGGLLGAVGFKHVGYVSTVPLALLLLLFAIVPAFDDLANLARRWSRTSRLSQRKE
ncbi:putative membrane protein [Variovorax sp. PBL-H6]|uniref:YoaK family protein n=1 Tax=Variovorax sp. PBL-H6 TaxID=434009 RepID=UPI0013178F15|nr:YoaK family protein [Variovorax sp. PBL-H6]VTU27724.1 putative membrane protein [Variovorax sp. PBL-H6]